MIEFEVDDQSAEDLALGLERLRAEPGVHDVLQMPAFGKKGRMMTHVQVLARPDALDAVDRGLLPRDDDDRAALRHGGGHRPAAPGGARSRSTGGGCG